MALKVAAKQKQWPTKTTLNLIPKKKGMDPAKMVLGLIVVAAVAAAFCIFAVILPLSGAAAAQSRADAAELRLSQLRKENTEFDMVRTEYARHFSNQAVGDELPVSCVEVLDLIESALMPDAKVESMSFSGNSLTVQLTGTDLPHTTRILDALGADSRVLSVDLYTAADKVQGGEADPGAVGGSTSVVMSITLGEKEGN